VVPHLIRSRQSLILANKNVFKMCMYVNPVQRITPVTVKHAHLAKHLHAKAVATSEKGCSKTTMT